MTNRPPVATMLRRIKIVARIIAGRCASSCLIGTFVTRRKHHCVDCVDAIAATAIYGYSTADDNSITSLDSRSSSACMVMVDGWWQSIPRTPRRTGEWDQVVVYCALSTLPLIIINCIIRLAVRLASPSWSWNRPKELDDRGRDAATTNLFPNLEGAPTLCGRQRVLGYDCWWRFCG